MIKIIHYYLLLHRKKHLLFDVILSILLTYLSINICFLYTTNDPANYVKNTASLVLPVLTFLATLHTTSLIFFANSNADIIMRLKADDMIIDYRKLSCKKIHQVYAYYAWAIVVQFTTLLYALILIFSIGMNYTIWTCNDILSIGLNTLTFGVFYSIVLSLRNVGLFFSILTYKPPQKNDTTPAYYEGNYEEEDENDDD